MVKLLGTGGSAKTVSVKVDPVSYRGSLSSYEPVLLRWADSHKGGIRSFKADPAGSDSVEVLDRVI